MVQNQQINIIENDYISLTDIAKHKDEKEANEIIRNWLRNRNTIEFLGLWEQLNNNDFKPTEFDRFRKEAGLNSFTMSTKKWCENTNARGIISKSGRYGGTYAHKDIAFEFASWVSVEFKLYLIKEFQRLKDEEIVNQNLDWDIKRTIVKINYHIHTDAIKNNLIPIDLAKNKVSFIYANEADLLNLALFGVTAKQWSEQNPDLKGNIRDYSSSEQFGCIS
ncbi:KilA domain-containing protein [Allofrancisella inopinata]|nr:KilA domain-containing protein [Allofrancisella inopinata]